MQPEIKIKCPGGCGCDVPKSVVDAVIANRDKPNASLDVFRQLLNMEIDAHRTGKVPPSEHGGLWENGFMVGLEQARNILNHVTGVPLAININEGQ